MPVAATRLISATAGANRGYECTGLGRGRARRPASAELRIYEREGLLQPLRSQGGTRRYSRNDVLRLQEICTLTGDGLNMAGIRRVLQLQEETRRLQAEIARLKKLSGRDAR